MAVENPLHIHRMECAKTRFACRQKFLSTFAAQRKQRFSSALEATQGIDLVENSTLIHTKRRVYYYYYFVYKLLTKTNLRTRFFLQVWTPCALELQAKKKRQTAQARHQHR